MKRAAEPGEEKRKKTLEELKREALERQKRIDEKLSKIQTTTTPSSTFGVVLNSQGQVIDREGNILQTNSLKRGESKPLKLESPSISTNSILFDPNLSGGI
jgi:phenylalanyl-tRNA synthetase alpha subunit